MTPKRIALLVTSLIVMGVVTILGFKVVCNVDDTEIVVLQELDGDMEVWSTAGWRYQGFGKVTRYPKSQEYTFQHQEDDQGTVTSTKECLPIRFNDKGKAVISGNLSWDMPTDPEQVLALHSKYRNSEGIENRLVKPAVNRAIYHSGPLMSSKESAGQRRGELIRFIQDQAIQGVYKTVSREVEEIDHLAPPVEVVEKVREAKLDDKGDPMLDDKGDPIMIEVPKKVKKPATKKITVYEPEMKDGQPLVEEESNATKFGVLLHNITIKSIIYEPKVQEQINAQRDMEMSVQTKIAEASKAKQDAVTAEEKGKAEAAKAKWEQEVKKAQALTAAEQKQEVAKKDLEAAKLEREAAIERAKGESEAKRLVMQADGALQQKLAAWVEVQKAYAAQMGKQRWVPTIQMGEGSSGGGAAAGFMQLMQAQAARQLNLDMQMGRKR